MPYFWRIIKVVIKWFLSEFIFLVTIPNSTLKFIYSEKATKSCEISTLLLFCVVPVKSKVEILQNFVAFSEYMNFMTNFEYF